MPFKLDHIVLAQLDMPDVATTNAQLNELLQPGGQRVEPAPEYEARDSTGTVRIAVNSRRQVTDVDIQLRWVSRIPAARLADVVFQTYVTAIQRAMVVELANARPPATPLPVSEAPAVGDGARSFDEWNAMIRARMSDVDEQLERIHRMEANRPAPVARDVRSPRGFFVLHLRGGGAAGLTGSVNALTNAGSDRLRLDLLEVFAAAELASPVDEPARSARQSMPEDDEEPFEFRYDD